MSLSYRLNFCAQDYVCSSNNNLNLYSAFLNIVSFTVLAESCLSTHEVNDHYIYFLQEA